MSTDKERITAIETREEIRDKLIVEIHQDVKDIKNVMNRQRGFIHGMLATATLLGGIIVTAIKILWDKIHA